MTWKTKLRPASYRGVAFHCDDRSHESGRRIHNHEYPKRDDNFVEDMGRRTRTWSVDAYLIGDDYMARRDALVAACERQGAGAYVDRWRGAVQAVCESMTLVETEHEGRYCKVTMKFIAAGAQPSAMGVASAAAQIVGAAQALAGAALGSFARSFPVGQQIDPRRLGELGSLAVEIGTDRIQVRGVDGLMVGLAKVF